jgi:ABC-type transport system involved in multi-copper enzyme maturation permease subunit
MTSLVKAELLKVRTVRLFWAVIGSALGVTALALGMQVVNAGRAGTPSYGTAQSAVNVLSAGGWSALVALVLGIVMMTSEYRHTTIATTALITPARGRIVTAKVLAAVSLGFGLAVLTTSLSAVVGVVTGALTVAAANAAVVRTVAGAALTIPLYAAVGVGLGSLVQNQTVAVASALVWFLVGETLLG